MLTNQRIICISSIDWDFLWQQHQEIMATFAQYGNTVLYVENTGVRPPRLSDVPRILHRLRNWRRSLWGFRKEREHLYIYSPLILPFPYSRVAGWINRWIVTTSIKWWMRSVRFHNPIFWTFLPTQLTLDIAEAIDHQLLVYYATDNFAATSKAAGKIRRVEPDVLKAADLVFVNSCNRLAYCQQYSPRVVQVPMGISVEVFEEAKRTGFDCPEDLRGVSAPIIGYIGGVRTSIDQALVRQVAEAFPRCTVAMVGPLQTNVSALKMCRNILLLGNKAHREIPWYIQAFSCCVIPYVKDEYTDSVSAAKLGEYLIMGKPVVSTNIAEIEAYAQTIPPRAIYVARTAAEFIQHVRTALAEDGEHRMQRVQLARERAWSRIIETMSAHIEARIRQIEAAPLAWQERFTVMGRRIRRRLLTTTMTLGLAYAVFAYSPLVWWVGAPLKIAQPPRQSDAIVVFAGGVGESGQAGQGYTERVERAVELYRQGYAHRLILSSGYVYSLNETDVMKALAVSLGVPPAAILSEPRARNTYQNVRFTGEMVRAAGGRSILLVSSPYHMRRCLLVFHRQLPALTVIPTPIERSVFFAHGPCVEWRQWRAILHEYAGILCYWLYGYL